MKTRILRVESPDFAATSTWVKQDDGEWVCTSASPALNWVKGHPVHEVKEVITEKGWTFTWLDK